MKKTIVPLVVMLMVSLDLFAWEIGKDGVDDVILGRPLPAKVLKGEKQRYDRMIADFVPVKGFVLKQPPVTVVLKKGKVYMIIIDGPGLKTADGLGLGSTLDDIRKRYQEVYFNHVPPTFGNDEAVAFSKEAPNIKFYFTDVESASKGKGAIRIMLFKG